MHRLMPPPQRWHRICQRNQTSREILLGANQAFIVNKDGIKQIVVGELTAPSDDRRSGRSNCANGLVFKYGHEDRRNRASGIASGFKKTMNLAVDILRVWMAVRE